MTLEHLDDAALVRLAQQQLPHDVRAYSVLMRRHQQAIVALARRFTGDATQAQDLAQEAMLRVFFQLPRFRGESQFRTWLWRLTTNLCLDWQRRLHPWMALDASVERPHEDDAIVQAEARADVNKLLAQLGSQDRLIVLLRYVADLDWAEIAQVMNMGLSAVKMRHQRAIDRLRGICQCRNETGSLLASETPCRSGR